MNTKEILEQIARRHNTTPEVVEMEMRNAIRQAMCDPSPQAKNSGKRYLPMERSRLLSGFFRSLAAECGESECVICNGR